MKKTAKILAILTVLCTVFLTVGSIAAMGTTTDLLAGIGNFEERDESSDPVGWTLLNGNSSGVSARKNADAKEGEMHLRINGAGNGVSKVIAVEGGKEYTLSMWVRTNITIPVTETSAFMSITFNGTENTGLIFDRGNLVNYYFANTSGEWKEFRTVVTATQEATTAELLIRTGNASNFSGTFDVDNVIIRAAADGDNHVFDGDFESVGKRRTQTTANAKYQTWVTQSGTASDVTDTDSTYKKIVAGTEKGSGSYPGYGNIHTTIGVEAGRVYKFSFSAKAGAGNSQYGILLQTLTHTSNSITYFNPVFDVTTENAGKWETNTIYFIASKDNVATTEVDEETRAIKVQLYANQPEGEVCFDNISLTIASESNIYFTDSSEVVQTEPDKVTRAIAFYVPETTGESTAALMVAIYKTTENGTTLDSLSIEDVKSTAGEAVSKNVSMTLPADTATETYHARIFLWDEIGLLKPLVVTEQLDREAE